LPWQQSAIHSFERKLNPSCVANIHEIFQGLKPKGETNGSFLVLHPSSGKDMVNTVGSHLKPYQLEMIGKYNCQSDVQINADIVPKMSRIPRSH